MWDMFYTVANNIGMSFENLLLLLVVVGGIVFYAKDEKLGVILHFFMSFLLFMWFYHDGLNYVPSLVASLIFLVIMTFMFYTISKATSSGVVG